MTQPADQATEWWVLIDGIGGYVCAAPATDRPDGICGMPTESEPCPTHTTEETPDAR